MPKILDNVKHDILTVTRKLLFETGYNKLNIRAIASLCGISTGTLYNYYKSKQEIVEEILAAEWKLMLRRIDQGIKCDIQLVDKLEIIYTEINILMSSVHNIWFESNPSNVDQIELNRMKCQKELLIAALVERIISLIRPSQHNKDYKFLADVICTLFITYSCKENIVFDDLRPIILSLLK